MDEYEPNEAGVERASKRAMSELDESRRTATLMPDLEITLPARAENVAVVRHAVGGLGDVLELDDQVLSDIKLAVTEACTNVVVHAYPDGEGPMGLRAAINSRRLSIVVADRGRGIVPRPDSPGLGLGLPLIATLAESLELGTGHDQQTEVRMTFDLGAEMTADGAPA
jgi:anti-sigma regulatory factor (Ser/Thr protein kinase)